MVRERVLAVEVGFCGSSADFGECSAKYILTPPIVVTTPPPLINPDNAASLGGKGDTIVTTSQFDVHALPTTLVSTDHSFKGDEETVLPSSADQGSDDNLEATGGEGADLVFLTSQCAQTTIATSGTQAQAPPPIVVVNGVGNVTKGE
jgi:hypothetical protein